MVHRSPHPPTEEGFKRVVMCSGKVYYELAKKRAEEKKEKEVAIIRLEQVSHPYCAHRVCAACLHTCPSRDACWAEIVGWRDQAFLR